jgi:ABC-type histidine transport system ATPase subunit
VEDLKKRKEDRQKTRNAKSQKNNLMRCKMSSSLQRMVDFNLNARKSVVANTMAHPWHFLYLIVTSRYQPSKSYKNFFLIGHNER